MGARATQAGAISARQFRMDIIPRERQTPEALGAMVKADALKWGPIIQVVTIKAAIRTSRSPPPKRRFL